MKKTIVLTICIVLCFIKLNAQKFGSESDVLFYLDGKMFANRSVNATLRFSNMGSTLMVNGETMCFQPDIKIVSQTKAYYTYYLVDDQSKKVGGIINSENNTITDRSNGRVYSLEENIISNNGGNSETKRKEIPVGLYNWGKGDAIPLCLIGNYSCEGAIAKIKRTTSTKGTLELFFDGKTIITSFKNEGPTTHLLFENDEYKLWVRSFVDKDNEKNIKQLETIEILIKRKEDSVGRKDIALKRIK